VSVVHDLRAIGFIGEVEIRDAPLRSKSVCLNGHQPNKDKAAQEQSEDALRLRIKIFTHVVPSFIVFVLFEKKESTAY
jgi:hypothetical protein